ncbi:MAG: tetratricopeptide repeat protein [Desulfobacterales bacterium]|nr:tetratricopeptide repeat protein [Desulfobacterales bacterium]
MEEVETNKDNRIWIFWIPAFFVIALGILAYSNSFHASFQGDDYFFIVENKDVHHFDMITLFQKFASRITVFLLFCLNYRFGELNVFGYHLINLTIHIINALIVLALVQQLFQTPVLKDKQYLYGENTPFIFSSLTAIIFVTHPIQTQAVTYIWQRCSSMVALFYLLAMYFFLKSEIKLEKATEKYYLYYRIIAISCGVLANFTKQNAFTLPVAVVFMFWFFFPWKEYKITYLIKMISPWISLLLIIPIITLYFGSQELNDIRLAFGQSPKLTPYEYFCTQLHIIPNYMLLILFPFNQKLDYDFARITSLWHIDTFLLLIIHIAIVILAIHYRKKNPLVSLGYIFFYLTLAIESSFIPLMDVIFEHRLYLPMLGFIIATLWLIIPFNRLPLKKTIGMKNKLLVLVVISLVCSPLVYATYQRNTVWETPFSLWLDNVQKTPNLTRAQFMLGLEYQKRKDFEKALYHFERANHLGFKGYEALLQMGICLGNLGKFDKSIAILESLKNQGHTQHQISAALAISYANIGNFAKAISLFRSAAELTDKNEEYLFGLAKAYCDNGQFNESIEIYQHLLKAYPISNEKRVMIAKEFAEKLSRPDL